MAKYRKGSIMTGVDGEKYVYTGKKGNFHTVKSLTGNKLSKGSIYEVESNMKALYKNTGKIFKGSRGKKTAGGKGG